MERPKPIKEVFIHFSNILTRHIIFTATLDAKSDFEEFGTIYSEGHKHNLFVSGHFDFQQVLEYIRSKE